MEKPADTRFEIHDLLADRWSPRAFSSRAVEAEKLRSLFEAARWAPSARNEQPWRFIIATQDDPDAYKRLFVQLPERGQQTLGSARASAGADRGQIAL
jgi:nitroreductase